MKLATFFAIAGLATCLAQGPRPGNRPGGEGRQPNFDSLKSYLALSDTQLQSLQQLHQQHSQANQPLFDQIRQKQQELRQLQRSANPDPAAVGRLVQEIQALHNRLRDSRSALPAQTTNVLTPDQKTKLKALEEAAKLQDEIRQAMALALLAPPERGEGAPGMMGMPGGGPRFGRGPR
ncbi:MAG: periplasmic heavy metal sensor [Acidimicrobiia bacterium]|nr:periplasmic heavy metal sensor [Acidimicrobiia bacterium]